MASYTERKDPPALPVRPKSSDLASQAARQATAFHPNSNGYSLPPNSSRAPPPPPQKPARMSAAQITRQEIQKEGDDLTFE